MEQLSKFRSILFHLYPGIIATCGFLLVTPYLINKGYPPQFGMIITTGGIVIPILFIHLWIEKKRKGLKKLAELNGLEKKLSVGKLILFPAVLIALAIILWGLTQPLNELTGRKLFYWLPEWYNLQDLSGFDINKVKTTLILNLILNGLFIPVAEEFYFRGYLLPRMKTWGNWAFVLNALLFSVYHFWQPYLYITLFIALLPMTFAVWKLRNLKLAIITHVILNITGSVISFTLFYLK